MPLMHIIAIAEGAGGLFDFNATLPLMAIQFILLTVVLTFVFYKPVSKVLEERETNHHTTRNFRMLCVYTNKLYGISPGDNTNYEFNRFNIGNYTLLSNVP